MKGARQKTVPNNSSIIQSKQYDKSQQNKETENEFEKEFHTH